MPNRRILSLWFPRLGAERLIRQDPGLGTAPFATVRDAGNAQVLGALSAAASAAGLYPGQPLRDAHAACADLLTRRANPHREAAFLGVLHRWAAKFSPWVGRKEPDALVIDLTGCAHLFGGEAALLAQVMLDCTDLGLSVSPGIADTYGAAWALARYGGAVAGSHRSGDAVDQEARATRSRAGKRRHWERGGAAPALPPVSTALPETETEAETGQGSKGRGDAVTSHRTGRRTGQRTGHRTGREDDAGRGAAVYPGAGTDAGTGRDARIAPPGKTYGALSALPIAALRLPGETVAQLSRLGLRRIGDLAGQPRASLARRFGTGLVYRLDQAMGAAPEPISPAAPPERFSIRLSLPDPIGLEADLLAALDRMLPPLCDKLRRKGRGARQLRFEAYRADGSMQWLGVGLARASADPERLRPLLAMKVGEVDAGFGIDMLRLDVTVHEPVHARDPVGHAEAGRVVAARLSGQTALDDLMGRLGARLGLEAITRRHPASSHIPEKSALTLAAAWSEPATDWPAPAAPRPLLLWRPEPVQATDHPDPPRRFRWRGRDFTATGLEGPERIAPEWWLEEPDWRSGQRDYWQVETDRGDRLWLYYAYGGALSSGWFCHGSFG
ncbi:Nucleotidyltransferase/DNA polymerase involved in DNA repair [Roseivivax lentus]|uniref:Nucleotidyltransferase/DNA polymerase involved in DNA repair n=1 Tax=Roseivivax lentus TaxID=633194 RepID=A0A1N7KZ84_9RHOB|nr:DNA polymerase Y family protein [Roseivivax lentus]SIS66720.1 Nucleotidyltransferase/DNA polymerase involved in DNA repair [Roseivivax lentus]